MLPVLSPAISAGGTRALCLLLSTRETQGRLLSVTLGAQPAGAAVPPRSPQLPSQWGSCSTSAVAHSHPGQMGDTEVSRQLEGCFCHFAWIEMVNGSYF